MRGYIGIIGFSMEILLVAAVILYIVRHDIIFSNSVLRHQEMLFPDPQEASATAGHRVFTDPDSYTWITYAKEMVSTGKWRINYTYSDNPPEGREAHWNSLLCWVLVGAGWLRHVLTGEGIYTALENGAFCVNSFQLLLGMGLWYGLARGPLGRWPTFAGLCLLVTIPNILWTFNPGRPDHQTLHFLTAFGSIVLLIKGGLGWFRSNTTPPSASFFQPPLRKDAFKWFRAAGAVGALGIWVGSTVQMTLLLSTAACALGSFFLIRRNEFAEQKKRGLDFEPALWFQWGLTGGAVTGVFYFLQYFPSDMRMRLETIHPLYAISWIGGAWLFTRCCKYKISGEIPSWKDWRLWLALAALLSLPLAAQLGPAQWHALRDPLIVRFQSRTGEGQPLPMVLGANWPELAFTELTLLPLVLFFAPWLAGNSRLNRHEWTLLSYSWFLCSAYLLLAFFQARWLMFSMLSFVVLIPLFLKALTRIHRPFRRNTALAISGIILAGCCTFYLQREITAISEMASNKFLHPTLVERILMKRLARNLSIGSPHGEIHVLGDPTAGPELFYFNGIKSVGSLFWQNSQGLRDTRDFYVSTDDNKARAILKEHGVNYVLVWDTPKAMLFPLYLQYGEAFDRVQADFLIRRLIEGVRVPFWMNEEVSLSVKTNRPFKVPIFHPIPKMIVYRVAP